jgi:predicted metalloendopeptidase
MAHWGRLYRIVLQHVPATAAVLLGAVTAVLAVAATPETDSSGLILPAMDRAVRPQDEFFRYANGTWLAQTAIPQDKSSYGLDNELADDALEKLRGIVEQLAAAAGNPAGSDERKIGDLYASFMDESRIEAAGMRPLDAELAAIAKIQSKNELPALIAHFTQIGVTTPLEVGVVQDARHSTRYAFEIDQGGLGLPDRDYYLLNDDAKLRDIRAKYLTHIENMLRLAGDDAPVQGAGQILALETRLARAQWTEVENRDPVKTYNKLSIPALGKLVVPYEWKRYLAAAGLEGKVNTVIVGQPSYLHGFGTIVETTPLPVWRTYFKWHLLSAFAPYLDQALAQEDFAFYGTILHGTPREQERWKRGVGLVKRSIGEGLGKMYVARYFLPQTKAHAEALVNNLLATYRQDIDSLDWMGPATKRQAQKKLAKLAVHIGYPRKWRDYSALNIDRNDLVGNVTRANVFEYRRELAKLGSPIDREEWEMTPQTVNAYYDPAMNEIVFPAAILQPPYFDPNVDDAANYGSIGAVIGHEISHGFDDQGSQFDADGNLRDWWTKEDHQRFATKTEALVAQYDAAEPIPGYHVNGKLTLGENIADNSGLAIAYKAYRLSLGSRAPAVIDGFTADQRFFIAYAQSWRGKRREPAEIALIKSNPHAPEAVRGTLPLMNQPQFYSAFDVKPGDKMYRPPDQRVLMW